MKYPKCSKQNGFTLIEILIVLAIIAVLVAILFPVLATVRKKGQQATCQSNLKQIGLAIRQYIQDHDSRYPQMEEWKNAVVTYSKNSQILLCPSPRIRPSFNGYSSGGFYSNYSYNRYLDAGRRGSILIPNMGGINEAILYKEAHTILNSDLDVDGLSGSGKTACGDYNLPIVHFDGVNYLFCDGHVKWLIPHQAAELNCSGMTP